MASFARVSRRARRWVTLAALAALVAFSGGCNFLTKLRARDNLNKGVKAFTEQKFDDAAKYFEQSIQLDPDFDVARMYLATTYTSQFVPGSPDPKSKEMAEKAIATFRDVVDRAQKAENKESKVNAMLSIASLNYQLKNYDESKQWCRKIQEFDPNNAEALYRIAVIDFDQSLKVTGLQGENVEFLKPEEKQATLALIEEGLQALEKAQTLRENYFDAMEYQNLLWREKAKFEKDQKVKNDLIRQADLVAQKALVLRLKAQEEEAKKPKKLVTK